MLARVVIRELKRVRGRSLILALVLGSLAGVVGGGLAAPASLVAGRDRYYEKLNFGHLQIQLTEPSLKRSLIRDIERLPDVEAATPRIVARGFAALDDATSFPVLVVFIDPHESPRVNQLEIVTGRNLDPQQPQRAVVDRSFAAEKNLSLGQSLPVRINGVQFDLEVGGVGISPEFLVPTVDPNLLAPPKGSLGIVYASATAANRAFADRIFSDKPLLRTVTRHGLKPFNNLAIRFRKGADHAATTSECVSRLADVPLQFVVPREKTPAYLYLEEELHGFYIFVPVCGIIMAVVAAIVAGSSLARLLHTRMPELATLAALGFSRRQIGIGIIAVMLIPSLCALAITPWGTYYFAVLLVRTYEHLVGVPPTPVVVPAWVRCVSMPLPIAVMLLAALVPLQLIRRIQLMQLMRGMQDVRFVGLPAFAEKLLEFLGPSFCFAVRNTWRRPKTTIPAVLSIALTVAMPAAFLTTSTSWLAWAKQLADELQFDAAVTFRRPLDREELAMLLQSPAIDRSEPIVLGAAAIEYSPGEEEPVRLIGVLPAGELRRLNVQTGTGFSSPSAPELILNRNFPGPHAQLNVGDDATVLAGGKRHTLRVIGLVSDPSFSIAYAPLETAQNLLGLEGRYTGASLRGADRNSLTPIRDRLVHHDFVETWQTKDEIRRTMLDYVSAYREITRPIVGVSLGMAFLFLITVMGILLLERDMEYAVIRSLGISWQSVAGGILIEVSVLGIVALLLALPTWLALGALLRVVSAIAYVDPGLVFVSADFLSIALPAVIVVFLALIPCMAHVFRVPVGYALHQKSFG